MPGPALAGALLAGGAAVFFGLGFGVLPFWAEGPARRRWLAGVFVFAAALGALGLALLALAAGGGAGEAWLLAAAALNLAATPLLVGAMRRYARGTGAPADDPRGTRWVRAYMVLAFTALALAGQGLLASGLAAAWVGWFGLALGAFLVLTFPLTFMLRFWIADLPLWVHVWGGVTGAALLLGP